MAIGQDWWSFSLFNEFLISFLEVKLVSHISRILLCVQVSMILSLIKTGEEGINEVEKYMQ